MKKPNCIVLQNLPAEIGSVHLSETLLLMGPPRPMPFWGGGEMVRGVQGRLAVFGVAGLRGTDEDINEIGADVASDSPGIIGDIICSGLGMLGNISGGCKQSKSHLNMHLFSPKKIFE